MQGQKSAQQTYEEGIELLNRGNVSEAMAKFAKAAELGCEDAKEALEKLRGSNHMDDIPVVESEVDEDIPVVESDDERENANGAPIGDRLPQKAKSGNTDSKQGESSSAARGSSSAGKATSAGKSEANAAQGSEQGNESFAYVDQAYLQGERKAK